MKAFDDSFQTYKTPLDPRFEQDLSAKLRELAKAIRENLDRKNPTESLFGIPFPRVKGIEVGHCVRCLSNRTISLADNSSTLTPADGVVVAISKAVCIVAPTYGGLINLVLRSDRGINTENRLYLDKMGVVTDQISDLVETTVVNGVTRTSLKAGVAFIQQIGVRVDEKYDGRCPALVHLFKPDQRG